MDVPENIKAQGPEAIRQFEKGYCFGLKVDNWNRVMGQCGPTGLSQLPRGDEQGKPPPGAEVLDWPERHLCFLEFDLFHEGGAIV